MLVGVARGVVSPKVLFEGQVKFSLFIQVFDFYKILFDLLDGNSFLNVMRP